MSSTTAATCVLSSTLHTTIALEEDQLRKTTLAIVAKLFNKSTETETKVCRRLLSSFLKDTNSAVTTASGGAKVLDVAYCHSDQECRLKTLALILVPSTSSSWCALLISVDWEADTLTKIFRTPLNFLCSHSDSFVLGHGPRLQWLSQSSEDKLITLHSMSLDYDGFIIEAQTVYTNVKHAKLVVVNRNRRKNDAVLLTQSMDDDTWHRVMGPDLFSEMFAENLTCLTVLSDKRIWFGTKSLQLMEIDRNGKTRVRVDGLAAAPLSISEPYWSSSFVVVFVHFEDATVWMIDTANGKMLKLWSEVAALNLVEPETEVNTEIMRLVTTNHSEEIVRQRDINPPVMKGSKDSLSSIIGSLENRVAAGQAHVLLAQRKLVLKKSVLQAVTNTLANRAHQPSIKYAHEQGLMRITDTQQTVEANANGYHTTTTSQSADLDVVEPKIFEIISTKTCLLKCGWLILLELKSSSEETIDHVEFRVCLPTAKNWNVVSADQTLWKPDEHRVVRLLLCSLVMYRDQKHVCVQIEIGGQSSLLTTLDLPLLQVGSRPATKDVLGLPVPGDHLTCFVQSRRPNLMRTLQQLLSDGEDYQYFQRDDGICVALQYAQVHEPPGIFLTLSGAPHEALSALAYHFHQNLPMDAIFQYSPRLLHDLRNDLLQACSSYDSSTVEDMLSKLVVMCESKAM